MRLRQERMNGWSGSSFWLWVSVGVLVVSPLVVTVLVVTPQRLRAATGFFELKTSLYVNTGDLKVSSVAIAGAGGEGGTGIL